VLVLAAGGVILAVTAGLVGVAGAHAVRQRAAAAADSAALAGADTSSGLVGGYPCDAAAEAARLAGAELLSCIVQETQVQVQVRIRYGVLGAVVAARAGPPPADPSGRKLSDDLQD
jgi:secretion/DNA translocation related TadE-like protein